MASYIFSVAGSKGDIYNVSFVLNGNRIESKCTCVAGVNGLFCKHRFQLLNGDITNLKSENISDLEELHNELPNIKFGLEYFRQYKVKSDMKKHLKIEKNKLESFVSPEGLNIKGFGKEFLNKIVEHNLAESPIDILNLYKKKEFVIKNKIFSDVKFDKILAAIEESKNIKFENFLFALSIPGVGEHHAKTISNNFQTLDKCFNCDVDNTMLITGLGEEVVKSFVCFFNDNKPYIQELIDCGMNINYGVQKRELQTLKHKKIAFTGKLNRLDRRKAKILVEELGGENLDVINCELDILVIGDNAGSKLQKAKKISTILILTEDEFVNKYCFDIFL